jgi:hypothetical protein
MTRTRKSKVKSMAKNKLPQVIRLKIVAAKGVSKLKSMTSTGKSLVPLRQIRRGTKSIQ